MGLAPPPIPATNQNSFASDAAPNPFETPPRIKHLTGPAADFFNKTLKMPALSAVMVVLGNNGWAFTGSVAMHIHAHNLGQPQMLAKHAEIGDADVVTNDTCRANLSHNLAELYGGAPKHPPEKFEIEGMSVDVIKSEGKPDFGNLEKTETKNGIPVMPLIFLLASKKAVKNDPHVMQDHYIKTKTNKDIEILEKLLLAEQQSLNPRQARVEEDEYSEDDELVAIHDGIAQTLPAFNQTTLNPPAIARLNTDLLFDLEFDDLPQERTQSRDPSTAIIAEAAHRLEIIATEPNQLQPHVTQQRRRINGYPSQPPQPNPPAPPANTPASAANSSSS